MSIDYEPERRRYRVRWRENGRQRSRRFHTHAQAEAFEASLVREPELRVAGADRTGRRGRLCLRDIGGQALALRLPT
jgi:hypothetical protein